MRSALNTLRFLVQHPLNRGRPVAAMTNFFRWQIGSRLVPGPVAVPFVENTRLLAKPGMTGATGNVYCGLHEYQDMGFVLHALRPNDVFLDAGANIGSYTILAAGVCGATVVAVEPIPGTFTCLMDNIRLNNLEARVRALNAGLGSCPGTLRFSEGLDTTNHVLTDHDAAGGIPVPIETLDTLMNGHPPAIIKIDVEGYETEVLKGAVKTMQARGLLAVLMELNGSGKRYGFDEGKLHTSMIEWGFTPCEYDPQSRTLTPLNGNHEQPGNTLYVRDIPALTQRVKSAPKRRIHDVYL